MNFEPVRSTPDDDTPINDDALYVIHHFLVHCNTGWSLRQDWHTCKNLQLWKLQPLCGLYFRHTPRFLSEVQGLWRVLTSLNRQSIYNLPRLLSPLNGWIVVLHCPKLKIIPYSIFTRPIKLLNILYVPNQTCVLQVLEEGPTLLIRPSKFSHSKHRRKLSLQELSPSKGVEDNYQMTA